LCLTLSDKLSYLFESDLLKSNEKSNNNKQKKNTPYQIVWLKENYHEKKKDYKMMSDILHEYGKR
jgi:hypothetical protein